LIPLTLPWIGGESTWLPEDGILTTVKKRGYLRCGVNDNLRGFSQIQNIITSEEPRYYDDAQGFDTDFCRVIAAAVFGDPRGRVKFLPLRAQDEIAWRDRFKAVTEGHVDVLVRNTSVTAGRELSRAVTFGPIIFYDRQVFLKKIENPIESIDDVKKSTRICVTKGTSTEHNLDAIFGDEYKKITETKIGDPLEDNTTIIGSLEVGHCDLITGDFSQIAPLAAPGSQYQLIEGEISRELLSPVSVKGDRDWSDIIRYAVYATFLQHLTSKGVMPKNLTLKGRSCQPTRRISLALATGRLSATNSSLTLNLHSTSLLMSAIMTTFMRTIFRGGRRLKTVAQIRWWDIVMAKVRKMD